LDFDLCDLLAVGLFERPGRDFGEESGWSSSAAGGSRWGEERGGKEILGSNPRKADRKDILLLAERGHIISLAGGSIDTGGHILVV